MTVKANTIFCSITPECVLPPGHIGECDPAYNPRKSAGREFTFDFVVNSVEGMPFQASYIFSNLVPLWANRFAFGNAKYADVDQSLGLKGVFPDINRKVGILKSRIWEGKPTVGESTEEVISDLIGHLFLMWYLLDEQQ